MSQYLKSPDDIVTSSSLVFALKSYVLNEFHDSLNPKNLVSPNRLLQKNGEELVKTILDNSDNQLRMYGSADELAENIEIYQNFRENYRCFGTDLEMYNSSAIIYHSLTNKQYVSKRDLFVILQNMTFKIFPGTNTLTVRTTIISAIRGSEDKLSDGMEFVRFDQNVFDEIEKEMQEARKICITNPLEIAILEDELLAGNFNRLAEKFQHLNARQAPVSKASACQMLKVYYDKLVPEYRAHNMGLFLIKTAILRCLPEVMKKRPDMFLPAANQQPTPKKVRLFEDGEYQFVISTELFEALDLVSQNPGGKVSKGGHDYVITTIDLNKNNKAVTDGTRPYELIRTPILRSKHKAVPIKAPDGNTFCVLAVDGLFELMRTVIHGRRLFQKIGLLKCKDVPPFFVDVEAVFSPVHKTAYFVKLEKLKELKRSKYLNPPESPGLKQVRNAKPDGFTVQNLINELKHLGLTDTFPEIQDYAEVVYKHVDQIKKERFLRSCDLFDAVEICQLICFFNRLPNLKIFVHNQKGCGRIPGWTCDECEKKEKEIQNPMENLKIEDSDLSKLLKETEEELKLSLLRIDELEEEMSALIKEQEKSQQMETREHEKAMKGMRKEVENRQKQNTTLLNQNQELKTRVSNIEELVEKQKDTISVQSENLEKSKKELKKSRDSVKKMEKRMKDEERERKKALDEKIVEVENLKKQIESQIKFHSDDDKRRISRIEKREEALKEAIANEKAKSEKNEREFTDKSKKLDSEKRGFEQEILDKRAENHEFQMKIMRLETENRSKEEMMQQLMVKLSNISVNGPIGSKYLGNIGVSTSSSSSSSSPPEVTNPKKSINSEEYPDSECPICLVEMKPKEKKINCNQCKKEFHSKCASEWLKVKSECPACRGRLLDPNEFPAL